MSQSGGRVTGIGGFFFRAKDPKALSAWYALHLGFPAEGGPWQQDAGPTVMMPFGEATEYFPTTSQFMLNLRVEGLEALLARLQDSGITAERRADWDGDGSYGRFARISDPEGNPIELWEPKVDAAD